MYSTNTDNDDSILTNVRRFFLSKVMHINALSIESNIYYLDLMVNSNTSVNDYNPLCEFLIANFRHNDQVTVRDMYTSMKEYKLLLIKVALQNGNTLFTARLYEGYSWKVAETTMRKLSTIINHKT